MLQSHRPRVCESIRTTALQASAPPDFYKWISERSGGLALLDETPLMESTTPLNVTRTLMTECDMQIMDQFLDVSTEETLLLTTDPRTNYPNCCRSVCLRSVTLFRIL